jgi:protein AroM
LCTGAFPEISCSVPVLWPGRILPAIIWSISRTKHVAVVTSVEGQVPFAQAKWEKIGFRVDTTWASPFAVETTKNALNTLQDSLAEIVVLDCFGHDSAYKQVFIDAMQRPVLVAQTLIARIAGEFF